MNSGSLKYSVGYYAYSISPGSCPFLFAREDGEEQAGRRQRQPEGREDGREAVLPSAVMLTAEPTNKQQAGILKQMHTYT